MHRTHLAPLPGPSHQRTHAVLDIENLVSTRQENFAADIAEVFAAYRRLLGIGARDTFLVGAGKRTSRIAAFEVPVPCQFVVGRDNGRNAADNVLLEAIDTDFLARRYDRVIIGSGDTIFSDTALKLRAKGVHVTNVVRARSKQSWRLRAACHDTVYLETTRPLGPATIRLHDSHPALAA